MMVLVTFTGAVRRSGGAEARLEEDQERMRDESSDKNKKFG